MNDAQPAELERGHFDSSGMPLMAFCSACETHVSCVHSGPDIRFVEHGGKVFRSTCPNSHMIAPRDRKG